MINIARAFIAAFLVIASLQGCSGAQRGEPSARVSVDRRAILIGNKILYRIEVAAPKGMEIELPVFKDMKAGDFEIKDYGHKTEKLASGGNKYVKWYAVTSYTPGKYKTPVAAVRYKGAKDADWKAKGLGQIDVTVDSVLPKGAGAMDIKDIKGPIHPFEIDYWLVGGILIVLLFVATILRAYIRHKYRVPPKTPYQTAIGELGEARGMLEKPGDIKVYYVKISDCIRRYIESVFQLRAPEMTTQEFLEHLRDSGRLPAEYKGLMKDFMEACDLVKFARYVPARKEAESVLSTAKSFVDGTKDFLGKDRERES